MTFPTFMGEAKQIDRFPGKSLAQMDKGEDAAARLERFAGAKRR